MKTSEEVEVFYGVDYLAVVVAGAAHFVVGALWHGLFFCALFRLGFAVYNLLNSMVYEKTPVSLFLIDGSYQLAAIVAAAGILSVWR
jgi:hypothetical protein